MAVSISSGYTFVSGEVVTPTKLNTLGVPSIGMSQDKIIGTTSFGLGTAAVSDIDCTAAGRALLDDANAAAQRTTLGLGDIATQNASTVTITGGSATGLSGLTVTTAAAKAARVSINKGVTALTDGATISTDASLSNVFSVTLGGNRTLANPTNLAAGATYAWFISQDGTGSRTLSYGTSFKFANATTPTLTTTAGAVDIITGISDGTYVYASIALNFG